jgi:hypothetical protein
LALAARADCGASAGAEKPSDTDERDSLAADAKKCATSKEMRDEEAAVTDRLCCFDLSAATLQI